MLSRLNQNIDNRYHTEESRHSLWFDDRAEEAAKFYTSIFKNSKIGKIARYDKGEKSPRPAGGVGHDR